MQRATLARRTARQPGKATIRLATPELPEGPLRRRRHRRRWRQHSPKRSSRQRGSRRRSWRFSPRAGSGSSRSSYQHWGRNQGGHNWGQDRQARGSRNSDGAIKDLVRAVARLSLRQEDQQAIMGLDMDFMFCLQSSKSGNDRSVTDALYKTAQDWNLQKENEPHTLTQPMRNVLLYCLLSTLLQRVEALETDADALTKVREQGLVINEAYPCLHWDAEQRTLPSGASGAQGSSGPDQTGSPLDGRFGSGREVPCHSQPNREGAVGGDPIQSSGAEPHPGEPSNVGLHEPPCPLQLLALDSGRHETGQARPQPVSQDHPAASARLLSLSPGKVLNLVLLNSSNLCYANSGVLAVLWSIASTQQGLNIQLWEMLRLLHWLTRKPQRVSLPSLRMWQSITLITCDWQDPHSQHDAAEFLGFLSPALVSTSDAGRWEARLSVDPSTPDALPHQVVDHGQMWPLVLTTALSPAAEGANRAEWTLQSLIIRWRNQVVQHAAVTSPPILPLQLNRFGQDGSKVLNPISLSPTVFFPCFTGQGTNTQSVQYQLAAVQYHLGQNAAVGPLSHGLLFPRSSSVHNRR